MFHLASSFARVLAVEERKSVQPVQARIKNKGSRVATKKYAVVNRVDDERPGVLCLDRRLLIGMSICAQVGIRACIETRYDIHLRLSELVYSFIAVQVLPANAEIGKELKVDDQDPTATYRYFTTDDVDEVGDRRVFLEVERSRRIQKLNSTPPGFPIFVR